MSVTTSPEWYEEHPGDGINDVRHMLCAVSMILKTMEPPEFGIGDAEGIGLILLRCRDILDTIEPAVNANTPKWSPEESDAAPSVAAETSMEAAQRVLGEMAPGGGGEDYPKVSKRPPRKRAAGQEAPAPDRDQAKSA